MERPVQLDAAGLERFRLEGVLGEGAELQVFAATDSETGLPVVVKRPHPALAGRLQHRDIERRLAQTIELRAGLGDALPHLARLVGYTEASAHDGYFGDSLKASYTVVVEERARGVPLVGSVVDGVKGYPVGLPQNLFALHPLVSHAWRGAFTIAQDVLDVAGAFYRQGHLLLDLRPQNVFFDPADASITVVDVGSIAVEKAATRRRAALDLHDLYVEMFQWYLTPEPAPREPSRYAVPVGMDSVTMFGRSLDRMIQRYSAMPDPALGESAVGVLTRVRDRGYSDLDEFRSDFLGHLALVREHYRRLAEDGEMVSAWRSALGGLREPYWRGFRFDADADLAAYVVGG